MTFVHIGLPKTGTTALQREFFPRLPATVFLTHGGRFGSTTLFRTFLTSLCNADDDDYPATTFRAFLHEVQVSAPRSRLLISYEGLSGSIFDGCRHRERNAERLKRLLPDASIIIGVRHQGSMLLSFHDQVIRRGGYASVADFLADRVPGCTIDLRVFEYDRIVSLYRDLFGTDRVHVLPYELFKADQQAFLEQLTDILGIEGPIGLPAISMRNQSLSPQSRWVLRHSNHLFNASRMNPHPAAFGVPRIGDLRFVLQDRVDPALFRAGRGRFAARDRAQIDSVLPRYLESNARLQALTGCDLRKHDYPLPVTAP